MGADQRKVWEPDIEDETMEKPSELRAYATSRVFITNLWSLESMFLAKPQFQKVVIFQTISYTVSRSRQIKVENVQ